MSESAAITAKANRDCWGKARERDRRKARRHIRARVATAENDTANDNDDHPWRMAHHQNNDDRNIVKEYLRHVWKGRRSQFSTTFVNRHADMLTRPHCIRQYLFEDDGQPHPELMELFRSWYGPDGAEELWKDLVMLSSFTFYELAVWCGKYSVVSALLHGGINPCVRGCRNRNDDGDGDYFAQELFAAGKQVLQRFFDRFPLRLSTYLVQRVVEMRQQSIAAAAAMSEDGVKTANSHCPCSNESIPMDYQLKFLACGHVFCEMCFWNDMLQTIDGPEKLAARDVVSCLVCGIHSTILEPVGEASSAIDTTITMEGMTPKERRQESLRRLHQLPPNQQSLKSKEGRKKKVLEKDHLASSWGQAVLTSLGSTQEVRRDKFFGFVETNALPYVVAFLAAGVHVDWVNEYGQTALYLAV
jgi:hypothetical protein